MKHRKEWYTCDRCGEEIKEIPSRNIQIPFLRKIICNKAELQVLTADKFGYVSNEQALLPDIVSAEIVESYDAERKEFVLCGKCRKEFERFMRNE